MNTKLKNNSRKFTVVSIQFIFIVLKATSKSFQSSFVYSVATDDKSCQKLKGGESNSLWQTSIIINIIAKCKLRIRDKW
jgi:hypothetical protein